MALALPDWVNKVVADNVQKKLALVDSKFNGSKVFLFFRVKGQTTVYKKVKYMDGGYKRSIVIELTLPRGSVVCVNNFGSKFRATKAFVKPHGLQKAFAAADNDFSYSSETVVVPTKAFDMKPKDECGTGIHFFFNRKDADNYTI